MAIMRVVQNITIPRHFLFGPVFGGGFGHHQPFDSPRLDNNTLNAVGRFSALHHRRLTQCFEYFGRLFDIQHLPTAKLS